MSINKLVLASILVFMSGSAHAMDLGWAGAMSGAGKALADSASQWQALEAQQALMEQQARIEREREERAYQRQMGREFGSSQGNLCVASNATIGARTLLNGKQMKVTALYGESPQCPNPTAPILADVKEVN